MIRVWPATIVLLLTAGPGDDLNRAVRQLGDRRYQVREQAQRRLAAVGSSAEPALRAALDDPDPEVVRRARVLLDAIEWGVAADTPPDIVVRIHRYRGGDDDSKRQAVTELVGLGKPAVPALVRLAAKADTPEARSLFGEAVTEAIPIHGPRWLLDGDSASLGALLEAALVGESEQAIGHYVAFAEATGRRAESVEAWRRKPLTPVAAEVLTALHRAAGDWAEAERIARQSGRDDLLESVLWEKGDWPQLAARPVPPELRRGWAGLGLLAAYQRLAGAKIPLSRTVAELRAAASGDDPYETRGAAEALLLNRFPDEALELLDHPAQRAFRFELLAARLQFRDALELANRPIPPGTDLGGDEPNYDVAQVRLLRTAGVSAEAGRLLDKIARKLTSPADSKAMADLIKLELRQGRRDSARTHAARYLDQMSQLALDERRDPIGEVLKALYPRRGEAAGTWWRFFAHHESRRSARERLDHISEILEPGRNSAGPGEWTESLLAFAGNLPDEIWRARQALAEAWDAAGFNERAEEEYRAAARQLNRTEAWIALGDRQTAAGRHADAADSYRQAWNLDRSRPLPLYLLGHALNSAGRGEEGQEKNEMAFRLSLGEFDDRAKLADELAKRRHTAAAIREREFILRAGGYRGSRQWFVGNVLNNLARDYAVRRDFAKAADCLERSLVGCLRTGAQYIEASAYLSIPQLVHVYRARAELQAGRIDAALAEARICLELSPGAIELAIQLVPELERRNRRADADAVYERVVGAYRALSAEYPDSAFAHNAIAWTAANCGRDLNAALDHARAAVRLAPQSAGYLDTLSEVHFRRGERVAAIDCMKRCLELDPGNAYYRRQLARFEAGRVEEPPSDEESE